MTTQDSNTPQLCKNCKHHSTATDHATATDRYGLCMVQVRKVMRLDLVTGKNAVVQEGFPLSCETKRYKTHKGDPQCPDYVESEAYKHDMVWGR